MEDPLNPSKESVEKFSAAHNLPPRWLELKEALRVLVGQPDFWYRGDLRDMARAMAGEASEILYSTTRPDSKARATEEGTLRERPASPSLTGAVEPQALAYESFMWRAIELARRARADGDAPVGALVVSGAEILAEGVERVKAALDVSAHAELIAIREACRKLGSFNLAGCTLITTTEPCYMCSYVARRTGIPRIVIGIRVTSVGGASSRHAILSDPDIRVWSSPPELIFGVLEQECRLLSKA